MGVDAQLVELGGKIAGCEGCALCQTRTNTVSGDGRSDAVIMFVGEGPGEQEDLQGLPFVGRAGELLDEGLYEAGLERAEVFVTNIVKCRPPGNRNPSRNEMETCFPYLLAQTIILQPKLIVTLGKVSAEFLLGRNVYITKENGQLDFMKDGTMVMKVYHPAYILRNQTPKVREAFFSALRDAKLIAYGS